MALRTAAARLALSSALFAAAVRGYAEPQPIEPRLADLAARLTRSTAKVMTSRSSGSSWLIDARGYLMTNSHVVEDALDVKIGDHDERIVFLERPPDAGGAGEKGTALALVVYDKPERDLAVIRWLSLKIPQSLRPLELAEAAARPGALVATMGTLHDRSGVFLTGAAGGPPDTALRLLLFKQILGVADDVAVFETNMPGVHGFSGSPVVDQTSGRVIGMYFAGLPNALIEEKNDDQNFILGVDAIKRTWKEASASVDSTEAMLSDPDNLVDLIKGASAVVKAAKSPAQHPVVGIPTGASFE